MSTLSPVRSRLTMLALATVGLCAVSPVLLGQSPKADNTGGRSSASDVVRNIEQSEPIPYPTLKRESTDFSSGIEKTARVGRNGLRKVVYRVFFQNGKETRREELTSRVIKDPVPEIVAVGRRGYLPSRGGFSGRNILTMVATAYDPGPGSNGGNRSGRGYTGLKVGHGLVAVDPRVIPLGTRLYIEGYGYAVAGDTGGSIKGNRIDLGHDTSKGARNFGRRTVIVHILD